MRTNLLVALLVAVSALVIPAGVVGQETSEACRNLETDPSLPAREVCTERVYFECRDHAVANVDNLLVGPTSWTDEAPTRSVQDGAGCGAVDTWLTGASDHNPIYDAPFAGVFEGRISDLTLHAHVIDVGTARAGLVAFRFRTHLVIDGTTYVPRDMEPIEVMPLQSASGLSREVVVTVSDIGLTGLDDDGPHVVEMTLYAPAITINHNVWVWDAVEVPSGILFNPTEPAAAVIAATPGA